MRRSLAFSLALLSVGVLAVHNREMTAAVHSSPMGTSRGVALQPNATVQLPSECAICLPLSMRFYPWTGAITGMVREGGGPGTGGTTRYTHEPISRR